MPALRTWKCADCGATIPTGRRCLACANAGKGETRSTSRIPGVLLVLLLTPATIIGCSLALAESGRPGYGIALAVIAWLAAALWRLGLDFDEGIDIRQLLFPAPFDWRVKWERTVFFWTGDHPYFRAIHLGCWLALIVVMIMLVPMIRRA